MYGTQRLACALTMTTTYLRPQMGDMTLKVEVSETAPGTEAPAASNGSTANAAAEGGVPAAGAVGEEKKAATDPPRRKKSRFAPPPSGAETLAAGAELREFEMLAWASPTPS